MKIGLQIFDTSGNAVIDVTTHIGRFIGSFSTGGQKTGNVVFSKIIGQRGFTFISQFSGALGGPNITIDNSTGRISWSYDYVVNGTGFGVNSDDMTHTVYVGFY